MPIIDQKTKDSILMHVNLAELSLEEIRDMLKNRNKQVTSRKQSKAFLKAIEALKGANDEIEE
jgi:hypothetical protein